MPAKIDFTLYPAKHLCYAGKESGCLEGASFEKEEVF